MIELGVSAITAMTELGCRINCLAVEFEQILLQLRIISVEI